MLTRKYLTHMLALQSNNESNFSSLYLINNPTLDIDITYDYITKLSKYITFNASKNITSIYNEALRVLEDIRGYVRTLDYIELWKFILNVYFGIFNEDDINYINAIIVNYNLKADEKYYKITEYITEKYPNIESTKLSLFEKALMNKIEPAEVIYKYIDDYINTYKIVIDIFFRSNINTLHRILFYNIVKDKDSYTDTPNLYKDMFENIIKNKIRTNLIPVKYIKIFLMENILKNSNILSAVSPYLSDEEYKIFNLFVLPVFIYKLQQNYINILDNLESDSSYDVDISPEDMFDKYSSILFNEDNISSVLLDSINYLNNIFSYFNYNETSVIDTNKVREYIQSDSDYGATLTIMPEIIELLFTNFVEYQSKHMMSYGNIHKLVEVLLNDLNALVNKVNISVLSKSEIKNYSYSNKFVIKYNYTDILSSIASKIDDLTQSIIDIFKNLKDKIVIDFNEYQLKDPCLSAITVIYDIILKDLNSMIYGYITYPLIREMDGYDIDIETVTAELDNITYNLIYQFSNDLRLQIINNILNQRSAINENDIIDRLNQIYNTGSNMSMTQDIIDYIIKPIIDKTFTDNIDFSSLLNNIKNEYYYYCMNKISDVKFKYDLISGKIDYFNTYTDITNMFITNLKNRINFDLIKSLVSIRHSIVSDVYTYMQKIDNKIYNFYKYGEEYYIFNKVQIMYLFVTLLVLLSRHIRKDLYSVVNSYLSLDETGDLLFEHIIK